MQSNNKCKHIYSKIEFHNRALVNPIKLAIKKTEFKVISELSLRDIPTISQDIEPIRNKVYPMRNN